MTNPPVSDAILSRRRWLDISATGLFAGMAAPAVGNAAEQKTDGKQRRVHTASPHNAEPHLQHLVNSWETPFEQFYVRSHAPVPEVDLNSFRLTVEGMVDRPLSLTIAELADRFRRTEVTATMTCAGNRRSEHSLVKKVGGVPWAAGPIGNARWSGVRLADILSSAGVQTGAKHVWFESIDQIVKNDDTFPFGASIPLDKAMEITGLGNATLLATGMNGRPLPPDHGYPVRTVVPGYIGARSVKWLGRIVVSDRPSDNHYIAKAYKLVTEGTDEEWSEADPIYSFPVNSVICTPGRDSDLKKGVVSIQGYALPGGHPGRTIRRVEVSTDGGNLWQPARLTSPPREFCWTLWNARVDVNPSITGLMVRAIDSAGDMQPQTVDWNLKGYLFNAWYRTPVTVGT